MAQLVAGIALVLASTAACTTTRHAPLRAPRAADQTTLKVRDVNRPAVTRTLDAYAVPLPGGGAAWVDAQGRPIAPATVEAREDLDRGRGALEGALLGGALGVATGVAIGYGQGDDAPCREIPDNDNWDCLFVFEQTAEEKAMIGAFVLGVPGVLLGAIAGAVVGHRTREVVAGPAHPRLTVTPTSGGAMAQAGWRF